MKITKKIMILLAIGGFSCVLHNIPISAGNLYLDIHFVENMLFSRYGVDVYLDDEYIDTIPHGVNYTKLLENIDEGQHEICFESEEDFDVAGTEEFTSGENTTFQSTIYAYSDRIDIENVKLIDNTDLASISVPDLSGEILSHAKKVLADSGFAAVEAEADTGSIWDDDNWIVLSQNIEKGTTVDKNEKIILTCEKTKKHLEDRIIGLNIVEASEKAKDLSFDVVFVNNLNDDRMDKRIDSMDDQEKRNWKAVSIDPDSYGKRKAFIELLYYGEKKVPDVKEESLYRALSILANDDFSNIKYTSVEDKSVWDTSNWKVIDQSIEPGTTVKADSEIELFVKSYASIEKEGKSENDLKTTNEKSPSAAIPAQKMNTITINEKGAGRLASGG